MTILDTDLDERVLAQNTLTDATEHLKNICSSHAPSFVAVERRAAFLNTTLEDLLNQLDDISPKMEGAKMSLSSSSSTKDVNDKNNNNTATSSVMSGSAASSLAILAERHRLRRRTLLQHSALQDLLKLPFLMDACVRSIDDLLYEEALNIASFANTLERRYFLSDSNSSSVSDSSVQENGNGNQGIGVVTNVIKEIRKRELDLKRLLLARLRGEVTMPVCLEVVTALRRLNGIELERNSSNKTSKSKMNHHNIHSHHLEHAHAAMELKLQVDFFEARDSFLGEALTKAAATANKNSVSNNKGTSTTTRGLNANNELLDQIELYRTRCFEIATQFLAIFNRSGASTSSSFHNNNSSADLSLLSMWTTRRIQIFLTFLKKQVNQIDPSFFSSSSNNNSTTTTSNSSSSSSGMAASHLRDVIDATNFFAISMGRIGCDFQPFLPEIFEPQLVRIVSFHWNVGLDQLEKVLTICRETGVSSPLYNNIIPDDDNEDEDYEFSPSSSSSIENPPRKSLLKYPALARLCNFFLSGLNEFRRCLLPGTYAHFRLILLPKFLENAQQKLLLNKKKVMSPELLVQFGSSSSTASTNNSSSTSGSGRDEVQKLRKYATEMMDVFENVLEPYCKKALDYALGWEDEKEQEQEEVKVDQDEKNGEVEEELTMTQQSNHSEDSFEQDQQEEKVDESENKEKYEEQSQDATLEEEEEEEDIDAIIEAEAAKGRTPGSFDDEDDLFENDEDIFNDNGNF